MYYLCSESKSVDQLCSNLICTYAKDRLSCGVAGMSHVTRKPVWDFRPGPTQTGMYSQMTRGCTFWIKEEEKLYYI